MTQNDMNGDLDGAKRRTPISDWKMLLVTQEWTQWQLGHLCALSSLVNVYDEHQPAHWECGTYSDRPCSCQKIPLPDVPCFKLVYTGPGYYKPETPTPALNDEVTNSSIFNNNYTPVEGMAAVAAMPKQPVSLDDTTQKFLIESYGQDDVGDFLRKKSREQVKSILNAVGVKYHVD